MAFLTIEDLYGSIEVVIFHGIMREIRAVWRWTERFLYRGVYNWRMKGWQADRFRDQQV